MSLNLLAGGGRHRAIDRVAELQTRLDAADTLLDRLVREHHEMHTAWRFAERKAANAEDVVVWQDATITDLTAQRDQLLDQARTLRDQLAPYLAAEANTRAITVPPMVRDTTDGADQATEPIPVITLQQAFGSTGPAHVPLWALAQELPVVGRLNTA